MTFAQVKVEDLQPGGIIRSGREGYNVQSVETRDGAIVIHLGASEALVVPPGTLAWVEVRDPIVDLSIEPTEVTEARGWAEDGSYTTPSGITYTAEEMENAAYSGADFSIENSSI